MLFIPLPKPQHAINSEMQGILVSALLMKQAGQFKISMTDILALCTDYAGHSLVYDPDTETFTLKLFTREETNPRPETPGKG